MITEHYSTIYRHVARNVKFWTEKKNPKTVLKIFFPKCTEITDRTSFYELCYDCLTYRKSYGVHEDEAIEYTRIYRKENNYYGIVSPYSFDSDRPILMQDIELSSNENKSVARPPVERTHDTSRRDTSPMDFLTSRKNGVVEEETAAGHGEELTTWLARLSIEYPSSTNRTAVSSMTGKQATTQIPR